MGRARLQLSPSPLLHVCSQNSSGHLQTQEHVSAALRARTPSKHPGIFAEHKHKTRPVARDPHSLRTSIDPEEIGLEVAVGNKNGAPRDRVSVDERGGVFSADMCEVNPPPLHLRAVGVPLCEAPCHVVS